MEDISTIRQIADYGITGAILLAAIAYIVWKDKKCQSSREAQSKIHREERTEWRQMAAKQTAQIIDISERNITVISDLKNMLLTMKK